MIQSDGVDDVSISVNSSPSKVIGCNAAFSDGLPIVNTGVLCVKSSMLLQVSFMTHFKFLSLNKFSDFNTDSDNDCRMSPHRRCCSFCGSTGHSGLTAV